ncbi:FAD/NAD(P)-binding domain-containing protein [Mycena pura]|uniref:FAD/NAD(P)-binding domain-containing protein n=1 Tax=Mycena pura TaxID=153505 RepID=A0AAD6UYZ4_9AGAR|nr:FAD/NAD(P)-binding domain-containing protein [Mycena pura]
MSHSEARPLNVSIVGAGIGGLAAAVSLRRRGHRVRVFESSQIKTEIGAGVGLQPNALRVLHQFGYSRENLKPKDFDGLVNFDAESGDGIEIPWFHSTPSQEIHSVMCHRSDFHDELKRLAIGEGEGPPAKLHLDSKVLACDPEAGTITLANGEIIEADLVIGADGIHSVVRTSILGKVVKATATGWSCIRCLFDSSRLSEIDELAWLRGGLSAPRVVTLKGGPFLSFFIYPVRNETLINFVGFHEDPKQDTPEWTPTVTKEEILTKYHEFHPKFLRILDLPTVTPILRWQLRAMPLLPTWIRGRAALLGDAAHATLPLLGQGAAMAIEEAGTLGCLLPLGTTPDEVPARLEAYQALRKERGELVNTESVAQASPEMRGRYIRCGWLFPLSPSWVLKILARELQTKLMQYDVFKVAQEYHDVHIGGGIKV